MVQKCSRTVDDYQLRVGPGNKYGSDMACGISTFGAYGNDIANVLRLILLKSGTTIGAIYAYIVSTKSYILFLTHFNIRIFPDLANLPHKSLWPCRDGHGEFIIGVGISSIDPLVCVTQLADIPVSWLIINTSIASLGVVACVFCRRSGCVD